MAPKYYRPCVDIPMEWKAEPALSAEESPVAVWWEIFNDAALNNLEIIALANNNDLKTALYRVEEAWGIAGVNKGALFPSVTLNPGYSNTGELFKLFLPPSFPLATSPIDIYRIHMFTYSLPAVMNYELDLWGKNKNTYLSSAYQALAKEEAYCTALLTLTTEVANAYFQLCSLERQISLLAEDTNLVREELNLMIRRNAQGLSNDIEIANTEAILSNSEANYHNALRQKVLLENVIAALIGEPASNFRFEGKPLVDEPPAIPAGMPSDILMNRPDIRQAEKICKAQNRMIGAARASYFPSISLTGALGYLSPDFRQFLRGISRYWNLGANISQPIFEGGIIQSNLEAAWATFRQASSEYKQTVITAFKEVEDSLNNIEYNNLQLKDFQRTIQANEFIDMTTKKRNDKGLVSSFDVINSRRSLVNAKLNETVMLENTYLSTVQFIKSVGGKI